MPAERLQKPVPQPPETKVDLVESRHGIFSVHSNHVNVIWTAHDVRLKFGELTNILEPRGDPSSGRTHTVEERVAVSMSWTEAKLLLGILQDVIGRYEKLNGEIVLPKVP